MRTKLLSLQFGVCACLALAGLFSPNTFGQTLKQVAKFDLPGPVGKRFDYLTIDEDDHYLLSAHLAAGQTYVIDLGTNKVLATITDTPGAEGVEYAPELKKFYTSNAHDNTIGVVDLKQMKVVKKLKTEAKPDGSTYAAPFHKLYVSDERGKAEAVVVWGVLWNPTSPTAGMWGTRRLAGGARWNPMSPTAGTWGTRRLRT